MIQMQKEKNTFQEKSDGMEAWATRRDCSVYFEISGCSVSNCFSKREIYACFSEINKRLDSSSDWRESMEASRQ
jgi:hypothetical protein